MTELISVLTLEVKNYALSKGYEIDEFIYESLAWVGLEKMKTFVDKDSLEKNTIHDNIENEIINYIPLARGTKCN